MIAESKIKYVYKDMGHEPYCNLYFFFKDSNQEFVSMEGGFKHYPVPEELEKVEAGCR